MARVSPRVPALVVAVVVLLAVAAFLLWTVSGTTVTAPSGVSLGELPRGVEPGDLSLLLVTLDTTRADRLGCYGFDEIETPNLDRLAREGVLFEQAESVAPLTLPAHSSIFTGELPPAHGVRDNGGFYLDEQNVVLAELLADAGFRTGGFVGSFVLDSKWGIAQGFDRYFDDFDLSRRAGLSLGEIQRPAAEVTDAALAWLDEDATSRLFAWVHYYDPHSPYEAPEPFATRYGDRPYVGEIAYVDSQIGRLLDWLDVNERARDTIVMVIGDHGESLGEHGESGHGFFIYEGVTRVPFIVRTPYDSTRGRRVDAVVRAIDLLPTALDLMGIPEVTPSAGTSLAPLLSGEAQTMQLPAYSEAVYSRYHFGWSDLAALRVGDLKYIDAPHPELYDLVADPHEQVNLYSERAAVAATMRAQLAELEARGKSDSLSRFEEIDPDTRAQLASLGYLSSFAGVEDEPVERSELADPKDKIHLYNLMRRSRESSLSEGGTEEAIELLQQLLAEDPTVIDAWVRLGNEQIRQQDMDAAIGSYRRALDLKPDYDLAVINLANAYRTIGADEEARLGYEQFLRLDPRNAQVHYELAQLLIDRGELEEADAHLREAVGHAEMAAAQNARGVVALKRSDPRAAERLIREALEMKPDVRLAHFNLALLAEGRGDEQEAARLYRRELELYPQSYKVEFNLGRLLGAAGDRAGAVASLRRSIEINPGFAEGHFFLAKALLDANQRLDEAADLARAGLELDPDPAMAPMGHYLLADIFMRLGRGEDAQRELAAARALESRG